MQRKFQIFVSSTYSDLIEERQTILKAILDLGHIPSGMEGFYAADEEQLSYIRKIIDECDYYVLVLAGRYGSLDENGVSYTEREYDYAVAKGLTVLAFINNDLASRASALVDSERSAVQKLEAFKEKVSCRRLVSFWGQREALHSAVLISLSKTIGSSPGIGWIRGDKAATEDLLSEIHTSRTETDRLRAENDALRQQLIPKIDAIAPLTSQFEIEYSFSRFPDLDTCHAKFQLTWNEIVRVVCPSLIAPGAQSTIDNCLAAFIRDRSRNEDRMSFKISKADLETIKIQLSAHGIVSIYSGNSASGRASEFIQVTPLGTKLLHELLTVKQLPGV